MARQATYNQQACTHASNHLGDLLWEHLILTQQVRRLFRRLTCSRYPLEIQTVGPSELFGPALVFRWFFHAIDDKRVNRRFLRLHLEAQPVKDHEERRASGIGHGDVFGGGFFARR